MLKIIFKCHIPPNVLKIFKYVMRWITSKPLVWIVDKISTYVIIVIVYIEENCITGHKSVGHSSTSIAARSSNCSLNWVWHFLMTIIFRWSFQSQDLTDNSPCCLQYNFGSTNNPLINIHLCPHHLSAQIMLLNFITKSV